MTEEGSIAEWLARAAAGELVALQMLLVAHHDELCALARREMSASLHAHLEPEDVLQQVYVRVLQSAGRLEDRGPVAFGGWLRTVLGCVLVDLERSLQAEKRDVRRELPAGETPSAYDALVGQVVDSLTPSRVVARGEARALLLAALASLPPDQRMVLEMRYLRGQEASEVARAMQRSPEAIQMLAVRAVRKLRLAVRELSRSFG